MPYAQLLESIANTISEYRAGQIIRPTAAHVERWADQFAEEKRFLMLQELDHVLKTTYFGYDRFTGFISGLMKTPKLAGNDPKEFWRRANLLRLQGRGHSQAVMLEMFDECLECAYGLKAWECGTQPWERGQRNDPFIYLDDAIYTGGQLKADLGPWIRNEAPPDAHIHVIVIATHTSAEYHLKSKWLPQINREARKAVRMNIWRLVALQNTNSPMGRPEAEVYWPHAIPQDPVVQDYLNRLSNPLVPRGPGRANRVFSGEAGRQVLESELLVAGVNMLRHVGNPKVNQRPLGYSFFGAGFGATIVTFRNCPNNAPLALWWGDPHNQGGPLGWYPLLPRETRDQVNIREAFARL